MKLAVMMSNIQDLLLKESLLPSRNTFILRKKRQRCWLSNNFSIITTNYRVILLSCKCITSWFGRDSGCGRGLRNTKAIEFFNVTGLWIAHCYFIAYFHAHLQENWFIHVYKALLPFKASYLQVCPIVGNTFNWIQSNHENRNTNLLLRER